jgi:peptidoglycan/LPS O-acetylase OafA/YrhL
MMIAVFKGTFMNWFFTRPLVYIIGGMCYSIYLLHYAFFHLLVKYTAGLRTGAGYGVDLAVQMAVCIPIVLLASGVFYLLLEKPCMNKNWPRQLLERLANKW